jgi:DNA processing protein
MDDRTYRIALAFCEGVGPKTYHTLARKLESKGLSFADLFSLDADALVREFALTPSISEKIVAAAAGVEEISAMREALSEQGVEMLLAGTSEYPAKCVEWMRDSAPPLLYAIGPLDLLDSKGIGIVGSRDASDRGMMTARAIGRRIADEGAVVVSGLAPGIDTYGHLGALEGGGGTIACLADGVEHFRVRPELRDAYEDGALLAMSQHPPKLPWTSRGAMARNVVICALSDAIVVVEAQLGGGTMHSAQTARDMGKPLFVVDLDPLPDGNRALLRTGAEPIPVDDPIDVSAVVSAEPIRPESQQPALF